MANKPLKSIKFPGLNDRYTVPEVDATLAVTGAAADAKKVGDEISGLKADLEQIVPGLSEDAKVALLNCFAHVKWSDGHGQNYYDALEEALYNEPIPVNPFENADYEIGGWAINIRQDNKTVTRVADLENRARSVIPIKCSSGKLVAKSGYNVNAHLLTGLTYGTLTVSDVDYDGYLDGLYSDTTHYQWDTEKTIPSDASYVCVTIKKSDNTNFSASEIAALYGTAFEYVEVLT